MFRIGVVVSVLVVLFAAPVQAGEFEDLLGRAGQEVDQNQPLKAVNTLRRAMAMAWMKAPLTVETATLVNDPAQSFGVYEPRGSNVYKAGEPVRLYVRPLGYKFKKEGEVLTFGFETDFYLAKPDGEVLGGKRKFGRFSFASREPIFECFLNLTYTLRGLPPGEYILETVLHDLNGGQTSFKGPIVIE